MTPDPIPSPKETSPRRTTVLSLIVPLAFVLAYVAARIVLPRVESSSGLALALALLPVPFLAALLYAYVRSVRELDELGRRIQLEALAIAFPIALVIVFTAGLMHLAGFQGEGNWDLPRLWPFLILPYWLGLAWANRRYQ